MRLSSFRHVLGYSVVIALAITGTAQALPGTNTVASDDIINGQVRKADVGRNAIDSGRVVDGSLKSIDLLNGSITGADLKDGSVGPADLAEDYYTAAELQAVLANYVPRTELGSVGGVLRWGYVRDFDPGSVEVYIDNTSNVFPAMTVARTATGVYEVTVPGVVADGGYHGIFVSPQQPQTSVFRACKTFQTVSALDPADTLVVKVRCYDQNAALAATDFHILVLQ